MGRSNRKALIGLGLAAFLLAACSQGGVAGIVSEDPPVKVEKNEATGLSQLTLSAKAAERLGIATGAVSAAGAGTAIPYAALVYDKTGKTWVYTNPQGDRLDLDPRRGKLREHVDRHIRDQAETDEHHPGRGGEDQIAVSQARTNDEAHHGGDPPGSAAFS